MMRNTLPPLASNDLIINRGGRKRTRVNCVCFTNLSQKRRPPLMKFYCGIDLSARDCHVCVIDEQLKVMVRNELPKIVQLLEPSKANLKIVVESTFNWYWLIDGLQAAGFDVVLAHTLGLYLITGAKVKTDRRDAYALAKLLLVGAVPAAYIYPVETRPVLRDLIGPA